MRKNMYLGAWGGLLQDFIRQLAAALVNGSCWVHLRLKDIVPLFPQMVSDTVEVVNCRQ